MRNGFFAREYRSVFAESCPKRDRRMPDPGRPVPIHPPPALVAVFGLLGLAAAIGIGRFAFTPLLPLMQAEGLALTAGAWLASANYLGYFAGALVATVAPPALHRAIRGGLVAIAASTVAMAFVDAFAPWLLLRFVAGVASAYVMVGISAWALVILAVAGRPQLSGWVYTGVGVGIAVAGLVALVIAGSGFGHAAGWIALGALAALMLVGGWRVWQPMPREAPAAAPTGASRGMYDAAEWTLLAAFGGFGFGYILPATFIPAAARALVDDPFVFGWAWPFFGLAAALSTIAVALGRARLPARTLAIASLVVMAAGVLLPAIWQGIAAIVVSALCVGGTFMVMTLAGLQEARRIATGSPARLIAAMTTAFATGQLLGPMLVGRAATATMALGVPSLVAALVLLASAALLAWGPARAPGGSAPV